MRLSTSLVLGVVCGALVPLMAEAQAIDADARIVELRQSCTVDNVDLDNCFQETADLTAWLWGSGGRHPGSSDPVTVRVGPGDFDLFECDGRTTPSGWVTIEGSGRDVTRFVSNDTQTDVQHGSSCQGGVTSLSCTNLSFRNITAAGLGTGVLWVGTGDSQWQDVDIVANNHSWAVCDQHALGWYDVQSSGLHFFWNARFRSTGDSEFAVAFFNGGAEAWVYGSDFLVTQLGSGNGHNGSYPTAVRSISSKGTRIFGSSVRAEVDSSSTWKTIVGFQTKGDGIIHMHGGIINVSATPVGELIPAGVAIGILANSNQNGLVHTPDTAFNLDGAVRARLFGSGPIRSPFLWPSGDEFPAGFISQTGADLFVKTNEGPGQNEPRLFVYDSACSDRWRNTTTGNCYQ